MFYYCQCGNTYDGGVLVPEGIIRPCIITITVEILMMAEYQSPRVLSTRVLLLSLWRYLWWRSISPRGYYAPVFYYYHCGDTYDGGVLVPEGIIPRVLLLSLWRYLWWRSISPRGYYPPVFYYYHCGDTYDGGVLIPEGIIHPCFITITVEILMMAEYQSPRVLSAHVLKLSLWRYLWWESISPRVYYPHSNQNVSALTWFIRYTNMYLYLKFTVLK